MATLAINVLIALALATAAPLADPTVQLDNATVTGTSTDRTSSFLGIPFAEPP
jgi:acetylcholinesterase